ncbi:hypothetical protein FA95DRAFT_1574315 [Auriscalpium vulgare]|uniref:Uncharacterized protein n=1 Tax=Auriscalpium vulgare TaxID=40419 RepID=A0ACB8RMC2_9AGAM|nr:hypothetical protein FA95DRAFT_1574315 [Auriscalpium vulgare]
MQSGSYAGVDCCRIGSLRIETIKDARLESLATGEWEFLVTWDGDPRVSWVGASSITVAQDVRLVSDYWERVKARTKDVLGKLFWPEPNTTQDGVDPLPGAPSTDIESTASPTTNAPQQHLIPALYGCRAVRDWIPPEENQHCLLPFLVLVSGARYDVIQDAGPIARHPDLPTPLHAAHEQLHEPSRDDIGRLLVARDGQGEIGWVFADVLLVRPPSIAGSVSLFRQPSVIIVQF